MNERFAAAHLAEMHPVTLYQLLRLRCDVFVVEQHCPYPELDGRDLEAGSLMVWATHSNGEDLSADAAGEATDDEVVAVLRILRDEAALRIGRVAVHPSLRGSGLATRFFEFALTTCRTIAPELPIVLDAQEPLTEWYGRFGFVPAGASFVEDGIPHVPMRREAAAA